MQATLKLLLEANVSVHAEEEGTGNTPLHLAVEEGNPEMTLALLAVRTFRGKTRFADTYKPRSRHAVAIRSFNPTSFYPTFVRACSLLRSASDRDSHR